MSQQFDINQLRVAKPCTANWRDMQGDDQRRFCGQCKKNVYNVAGMTERQVRDLISKSEVLPCMRLARRADGTVVTRDCPVGVSLFWRKAALAAFGIFAMGFTMVGAVMNKSEKRWDRESVADVLRDKPIVGPVVEKIFPQEQFVVGAMAYPISGP